MENVKTFEQYLFEADNFVAQVTTPDTVEDEKNKENIVGDFENKNIISIQIPGKEEVRRFGADMTPGTNEEGDDIQITNVFEITKEGDKDVKKDIDDPDLVKYVKRAIKAIYNVKNIDKAETVERISGNSEKIEPQAEAQYDKDIEKPENAVIRDESLESLLKNLKEIGDTDYVSFDNLTEDQVKWFKKYSRAIGKGEYFLPILYKDVHKNSVGGESDKGDDCLIDVDGNKYQLEIKTSGAGLNFKDSNKKEIKETLPTITNEEEKEKYLKDKAARKLAYYVLSRGLGDEPLYLIIFENKGEDEVKGFWVLYVGKTFDPKAEKRIREKLEYKTLTDVFKEIIVLSDDSDLKQDSKDFAFKYSEKQIKIKFNTELLGEKTVSKLRPQDKSHSDEKLNAIKDKLKPENDKNYKLICTINPKGKGFGNLGERLTWKIPYIYFKYFKEDLNLYDIAYILDITDKEQVKKKNISNILSFARNNKTKFDDLFNNKLIDTESDENIDELKKEAKTLMWIYGLATGNQLLPENTIQDKDNFLTDEVSDEDSNEIDKLEKAVRKKSADRISEIKRLIQDGKNLNEIADELHISYNYANLLCKKYHIAYNRQYKVYSDFSTTRIIDLIKRGISTPAALAKELESSSKSVSNKLKKLRDDDKYYHILKQDGRGKWAVDDENWERYKKDHNISESFHIFTFDEMFND